MAQNVNPTFVKTPNRGVAVISTGTGTASVTLYTGGANGSKIVSINIANSSTAATMIVSLQVSNSATNYMLNSISMAGGAGFAGVTSVSGFSGIAATGLPVDSDGNNYVLLASSADTLIANLSSGIQTTGGVADFYVVAGDF